MGDRNLYENARRPTGEAGRALLEHMNGGVHALLAEWALERVEVPDDACVLDVGCGGGANLARHLARSPRGHVVGLDYSEVSVTTSRKVNAEAIAAGRCEVVRGDVGALPFPDASFDLASAFETVYFWPDVRMGFAQIARVLRPRGRLMVVNETDGESAHGERFEGSEGLLAIYPASELERLARAAGFEDVRCEVHPQTHWLLLTARRPS